MLKPRKYRRIRLTHDKPELNMGFVAKYSPVIVTAIVSAIAGRIVRRLFDRRR